MKNKGFTLVELLAVITILAIIMVIAVPNAFSVSSKARDKMFCAKINDIENAAKLYGQDRKDGFTDSINGYKGTKITVNDLVEKKYLKKDSKEEPYVVDPRDNSDLTTLELAIYLKSNNIYVLYPASITKVCQDKEKYVSSYRHIRKICKYNGSHVFWEIEKDEIVSTCIDSYNKCESPSDMGKRWEECIPQD